MQNILFVGLKREVAIPKGGCLFIDDEVPEIPKARIFDPRFDSFNPLHGIDYRGSLDLVANFDAIFSRGDTTLTKDTGLDFIAEELERKPKSLEKLIPVPEKKSSTGHVWAYSKTQSLLRSPVLSSVLCNPTNFSFNPKSVILARINRAELGDFDALVLGLFLISRFKGQVVVPDFGFYGRDSHVSLIREGRLVAGVNFLDELPAKLRRAALLIDDRRASGTTFEDAETLAKYARLKPGTNEFNDFVDAAVS